MLFENEHIKYKWNLSVGLIFLNKKKNLKKAEKEEKLFTLLKHPKKSQQKKESFKE